MSSKPTDDILQFAADVSAYISDSDSDSDVPVATAPAPVSYKTERMHILSTLSYLLGKVSALADELDGMTSGK